MRRVVAAAILGCMMLGEGCARKAGIVLDNKSESALDVIVVPSVVPDGLGVSPNKTAYVVRSEPHSKWESSTSRPGQQVSVVTVNGSVIVMVRPVVGQWRDFYIRHDGDQRPVRIVIGNGPSLTAIDAHGHNLQVVEPDTSQVSSELDEMRKLRSKLFGQR
jgi:hypothetical protein